MRWQGFGKRKHSIGMPRPKKTKVEAVDDLGPGTTSTSTGHTEQEEASASTLIEEDEGDSSDSEDISDKEARSSANKLVKMAREGRQAALVQVRKAEAGLRQEKRCAEERDKRWWAAEQRKEPPPAYLQLERAYKAQVKMLRARLALSEAQRSSAEADAELNRCLMNREKLEHAIMRYRACV